MTECPPSWKWSVHHLFTTHHNGGYHYQFKPLMLTQIRRICGGTWIYDSYQPPTVLHGSHYLPWTHQKNSGFMLVPEFAHRSPHQAVLFYAFTRSSAYYQLCPSTCCLRQEQSVAWFLWPPWEPNWICRLVWSRWIFRKNCRSECRKWL